MENRRNRMTKVWNKSEDYNKIAIGMFEKLISMRISNWPWFYQWIVTTELKSIFQIVMNILYIIDFRFSPIIILSCAFSVGAILKLPSSWFFENSCDHVLFIKLIWWVESILLTFRPHFVFRVYTCNQITYHLVFNICLYTYKIKNKTGDWKIHCL